MNAPQEEHTNVSPNVSPEATAPATPPVAPASENAGPQAKGTPRWTTAMDPRRKSVALASVLSCMPGLGQIYVGYYQLGFVYILIVAGLITILANDAGPFTPLFGLGLAFFWLYNVVDAGRRAALYNAALAAQSQGGLPEEVQIPMNRGSRVGGAILVVCGALFLMHTRFGFDMYWVEDWWPLGLILLGVWLFQRDRGKTDGH